MRPPLARLTIGGIGIGATAEQGRQVSDPTERERAVEAEAARWAVRLEAGPLGEQEQQDLEAWLRRDEAHAAALAFARETWAELGRLRAPDRPTARPRLHRYALGRRRVWQSLAALLLLTAGIGSFYAEDAATMLRADHRTAPGETRTVALPDGSSVRLNTHSAIAVRFDEERREVELLAGEAAFTVAAAADAGGRPFVVRAAGGRTRALGTRFVVHRQAAAVDVSVLEHSVEVTAKAKAVVVAAAQAVRYDRELGIGPVRRIDPANAVSWLHGRLIFDRVPLAEAVAELGRYRRERIVIMNPDLAVRRVSGVFRLDDLDGAVEIIAAELGARTATVPPLITVLY